MLYRCKSLYYGQNLCSIADIASCKSLYMVKICAVLQRLCHVDHCIRLSEVVQCCRYILHCVIHYMVNICTVLQVLNHPYHTFWIGENNIKNCSGARLFRNAALALWNRLLLRFTKQKMHPLFSDSRNPICFLLLNPSTPPPLIHSLLLLLRPLFQTQACGLSTRCQTAWCNMACDACSEIMGSDD